MAIYQKDDFRDLVSVSDEVFERITLYHALLLKWNPVINLVSPKSLDQAWHRHFIDSAQVSRYISDDVSVYADLGCGGGFPGLVVAMMRPSLMVHLVESDERKCQFMRTVVREAGLSNVTIHTDRIENITGAFFPDVVSARALASLEDLLAYCLPWAMQNANFQLCFLKGERADDEIAKASVKYDFSYQSHVSLTDQISQVLVIQNLMSKNQ